MLHDINNFHVCVIPKGQKKENFFNFRLFFNKIKISYDIIFNSSSLYKYNPNEAEQNINRLFGLSYGFLNKNMVWIGWRPVLNNNQIEIFAFCMNNGKGSVFLYFGA